MRRRAVALGVSVVLHVAFVALLVPRSRADAPRDAAATIEVTQVSAAELAPADQPLPEPADDGFEAALLHLEEFAFDLAKIRARENALFPFLTLDLMFLDRVARDLRDVEQRLSN